MKIWILQTGEPLHCDSGSPRPMRAMNLANSLVARGHEVLLWSAAFNHMAKTHRSQSFVEIFQAPGLTINLVPSPGYCRNIGPVRLYDHAVLARNLHKLLVSGRYSPPDVAFVGYPPIETAAVMSGWLKRQRVPLMIDAKDQWPTIFLDPLPGWLKLAGRLALLPYFHYARRALNDSDAFCAMSDEFLDWMCLLAHRPRRATDVAAPLTAPQLTPSGETVEKARFWWAERGVNCSDRRRISFVGSLSPAFDFVIVRDLVRRCAEAGIACQFVLCGDGDAAPSVRAMFAGSQNVVMPGWINAPQITALYAGSLATIAPYVNNDAFMRSVPNKVLDSFGNGLPVITTLKGAVRSLIESESVGISTLSAAEMFDYLLKLLNRPGFADSATARALSLFTKRFSYSVVYDGLAQALEGLADH